MSRPRILVLRALGLGDLLTAVPALRALREACPDHHIELATPRYLAPLLDPDGLVDDIVDTSGLAPVPARPEPDIAINLHGCGPQSHRLLTALRPERLVAFGNVDAGIDGPPWIEHEHERARWCRLIAAEFGVSGLAQLPTLTPPPEVRRGHGPIVLHPGAADPARRWPPQRWVRVARALREHSIVLTGTGDEVDIARAVADEAGIDPAAVYAGATDITELVRLVSGARLVLSADTGIAHLAAAYSTPSVTLFGPNPPSRWGPPPGPHIALWHGPDAPPSPGPVNDALMAIAPEQVMAAARQLIGSRGG
ncbi:glycosyltransferase family 9 protein [Epidermidibacterium keratini]|uniref:Glycosyltransferase family 9 protein n=1 Tax=Epidermidibacterium keratini TaxID=1891644 RepID=A0A7L4YMT9_9ACTN|nr:glycosyltransferase family 9 protein [Epidermidibacterium keratini]QHC00398.1 glycosyltransferase family 9 protein [Epidermidibacterium keratini]